MINMRLDALLARWNTLCGRVDLADLVEPRRWTDDLAVVVGYLERLLDEGIDGDDGDWLRRTR